MKFLKSTLLVSLTAITLGACSTGENNNSFSNPNIKKEKTEESIKAFLEKSGAPLSNIEIEETSIEGVVRVTLENGQSLYSTRDGKYVIAGPIIDLTGKVHLEISQSKHAKITKEALDKIKSSDLIEYKANEEIHKITVFFDPLCPYCKEFISQISELNEKGVTVNLLVHSISEQTKQAALNVVCSEDKKAAIEKIKSGAELENLSCDNTLDKTAEVAKAIKLKGTPSIYNKDGFQLPNGGSDLIIEALQHYNPSN